MIRRVISAAFVFALLSLPSLATPPDAVSGNWDATFHVLSFTIQGSMSLKADGETLTGTVDTEHTGHGTISDGVVKDGKLSFTANFEKHESIVFTGSVKDGKLEGEFKTEGNTGQWTAVPHKT